MTYILASGSPRRREICALAGIPVEIVPAPEGAEPALTAALPPEQTPPCGWGIPPWASPGTKRRPPGCSGLCPAAATG